MLKTSLLAAALTLAASAAVAQQDYRAQGWQDRGGGHAPYGYDNSSSALGRYCPPGYYPHSWPNGSGVRCEAVDRNSYIYQP